jgi:uncharacterized RDD family membrane protein YckC
MSDLPPPPPPPPPPSEPQPGPSAGQLVPVGPWPRFGARLIDGLVLFIPNAILAAVLTDDTSTSFSGVGSENFLYLLATALLGFAYAVWLEASRGQTVGKMVLGFKVVGPDGRLPAPEVAMRRNAWLLLGVVPLVGAFLSFLAAVAIGVTISKDPFKRGTHDNFAGGTAVVRAR